MVHQSTNSASPQSPRESELEFRRLVRGEGSSARLVKAIKRESRTYVDEVRAGRYRSGGRANGSAAA
jgi:hypothetical protein